MSLLDRTHLGLVIGALFVALHIVHELAAGETIPPPFLPLVALALLAPVLPVIVTAIAAVVIGGIFVVAQVPGHVIPTLQDGPTGTDYSGWTPIVGGLVLVLIGGHLARDWHRSRGQAGDIEGSPAER